MPSTSLSVESLHPGNFALVMATGIISLGLQAQHYESLGNIFACIAIFGWVVLLILCLARVARYTRAVYIDLTSPRMVFSYFTLVAATDIVGLLLQPSYPMIAAACWVIAFVAWCLLLYLAFSVLTFLSHESNVNIMHGGWLITIVGTQSLVLLGLEVAPSLGKYAQYMLMEVHLLWGLGLSLYGIFVALFCYRIFFLSLKAQDLSPLLWVVMGAAAISANAGTSLLQVEDPLPFLLLQAPFINGVTLMIWSWATWWMPMLFLFGIWKHLVKRIPLSYEPILWSMVFPLGMYAVASERLGRLAEFQPIVWIGQLMIWIAVLVWLLVMIAMLRRVLRLNRIPKQPSVS